MGAWADKRAVRLAAALGVMGGLGGSAAPAAADAEGGGACVLKIELSGATPRLPGSATWGLSGGGICVVSGGTIVADATVSGTLSGFQDLSTTSCLVALADGTLTLTVTSFGSFTADLVVAASAGVPVVLVAVTVGSSAAAGTFVQSPLDTAQCALADGAAALTWKGVLVFADTDSPVAQD